MGKNETLEKLNEATQEVKIPDKYNVFQNEMAKLQKKSVVGGNTIEVKEINDHKNISLWTKAGKRIGPLHPHNAKKAFETFWNLGIQLTVDEPTKEQIEAYKNSAEGKQEQKAYEEKRVIKDKSRKKGEMEKLTKEIANLTGQTIEAITNIVRNPNEIKPLAEGRASASGEGQVDGNGSNPKD